VLLIYNDGIVVYNVRQGTPAAKAGLAKGDVILSIDGVTPLSLEQVRLALRNPPGTVLHLQLVDKPERREPCSLNCVTGVSRRERSNAHPFYAVIATLG
jgi:C-terminal processing protease CtpA/Prc